MVQTNDRQNIIETSADELTFRGQRPNERVVVIMHQHPYVLMRRGLIITLMLLMMGGVVIFSGAGRLSSVVILLTLPIALYIALTAWYTWSNTIFVLTDHRVMAVYQKHWFSRNVTETELENIVSIEHAVEGFAKSFLNYGTVNIRSSGAAETEILLENVYDPYGVQQKILDFAKQVTSI